MPVGRLYSRFFVKDQPATDFLDAFCRPYFWHVHGYWPDFKAPRSFSEKVWARMLFERDSRWTTLQDKFLVREFVANKGLHQHLIPLLWHGDSPDQIPFDQLPSRFVLKATHGCHYNILVKDKQTLDRAETCRQLNSWLRENYCKKQFFGVEWGYGNIKPSIVAEEFIGRNGQVPVDYKFRCFDGKVEFMTVQHDRPGKNPLILVCDRAGKPIQCEVGEGMKYEGNYERAANHDKMIEIAERLSTEFDFIRVDLYNVDNHIYFGELTPYPSAGCLRFTPREWDIRFGALWKQKNPLG